MATKPAARRTRGASGQTFTDIDWVRVARTALTSRAMDELEEQVNRDRASVPREHLVLYQFSARGHEVAQAILGSLISHPHDAVSGYYRSRPLLLAVGLSLDDALGSPLGRAGGYSDGRDIGVVCNLPQRGAPVVLPMSGDVGSQYTPAAGWAQAIRYHRDVLGDASYEGAIAVAQGGEASVATNGFWSSLVMATTLRLPVLFFIEDNGLGISVPGSFQTPDGNIARNLSGFANLFIRDANGSDPAETARHVGDAVAHVRSGAGPALVRCTVPRLSSHSGPDNQRGYRSEQEIAADLERDPMPALRARVVPSVLAESAWQSLEAVVARDVETAVTAARGRPAPDAAGVKKFLFAEEDDGATPAMGGLTRAQRDALRGSSSILEAGEPIRFAEAVRRTLRHELEVNPRLVVFGEDVGRKGGVHLVTEGLQKQFGDARVFDTSLSEEGIIGRAVGMAISGLMPVAEIQFRKYADPAHEQLNNCGTMRWRTANRFAAPIVVRLPGGFGKDVGDPWHSLSHEVTWAHAYGWQVAIPSNSSDAVGLLRAAMRSSNPTIFFEHRALLMTSDGSARYPGDDYVLPFGEAKVMRTGSDLTLVTWGALAHRCLPAAARFGERVELIDLRTISPWDRSCVLESVRRTGRCLIVHEDNITAGFGAEIAATLAKDAFWWLDAPVDRLAVEDIPMPYHPVLLNAVLPGEDQIAERIEALLGA